MASYVVFFRITTAKTTYWVTLGFTLQDSVQIYMFENAGDLTQSSA